MLPSMLSHKAPNLLPPRTKLLYSDIKPVLETSLYTLYEAKSTISPFPPHTIRVFDSNSEFVKESYDFAATLFIKELLYLMTIDPGSVILNSFEISEDGKKIAFATLPYAPISSHIQQAQNSEIKEECKKGFQPSEPKDVDWIKNMISDVLLDVEFLTTQLGITGFSELLTPQSIFRFEETGVCFLGDWCKEIMKNDPYDNTNTQTVSELTTPKLEFNDIQSLGISSLELGGANSDMVNGLREMKTRGDKMFDVTLKGMLADENLSEELKELLAKMVLGKTDLKTILEEFEEYQGPRKRGQNRISELENLVNELEEEVLKRKPLHEEAEVKLKELESKYNKENNYKNEAYKFMRLMMYKWIKSLSSEEGYSNLPCFPNPNRPNGNPTKFFRCDADYWRRDFNDQFYEVFGYDLKEDYTDKYDTNNEWYQNKKKKSTQQPQLGLE